jgi:hypothetical protein
MNRIALRKQDNIFVRNHLKQDTSYHYEVAERRHKKGIIIL